MTKQKLKLSVNTHFLDKMTKERRFYGEGFENAELSLDEIAEVINLGCTISYQFRDGIRKSENFTGTDFLAVDIDYGMSLEQVADNQIFQNFCSIRHVTPNHTPDDHRFRLIFALPRTITKISDVKAAAISLTKRMSGDLKTTDAARMFHGCFESYPQVYDRGITEDFLRELIEDGKTQTSSELYSFSGSTTNRSDLKLEPSLVVRTVDGGNLKLENINGTTKIYCPIHNDHNPSAFVARSHSGSQFIHCSTCQKTWYVKGTSEYEQRFDDFDLTVRNIKNGTKTETHDDSPLRDLLLSQEISPKNITITEHEHLEMRGLEDGLTLIKSPKGTGKTTYLAGAIGKIIRRFATLEAYEEGTDFESSEAYYSKERVLLIGHRIALIGDLCNKLSLNSYLEDPKNDSSAVRRRMSRYGVCLDSLQKVRGESYDVIVIDEVEQVLSHFLSETIGEKRNGLFNIFCGLIRQAKKVVALDADLGWITYITLAHLTREQDRGNKPALPLNIQIFINDWQPKNRELLVYGSMFQLIHEIKKSVVNGRRIFIASNSRTKINKLTHAIRSLGQEINTPIPLISITSENAGNQESKFFVENIKTEILKYQVVLSSPTLGTGIDITFENGKSEIDDVFGLFENQINTHFEIDQQLARVRNPGAVHVWVSPRTFKFETDFRVAGKDFLHRHLLDTVTSAVLQQEWDIESKNLDPFLRMAALIVSHQRASKNRFLSNFIQYRKHQGWKIQVVKDDESLEQVGKDLFEIGAAISEQEWKGAILNASVMDLIQFLQFSEQLNSKDQEYSNDQYYSYLRTRIELFYGQVLDESLLEQDRKGVRRREILLFEDLSKLDDLTFQSMLEVNSKKSDTKNIRMRQRLFRDRQTRCWLVYGLLSSTPIFKDGKFDTETVFVAEDLKKFVKASVQLQDVVLTQLDVNTQRDIDKKPVQHLGKILAKIGLTFKKPKTSTVAGKKTYFYALDLDSLRKLVEISRVRSGLANEGWDFVNQQYGFEYDALDMEWLEARQDHRLSPAQTPKPQNISHIVKFRQEPI
jgi:Origin of replication binding protein